MNRVHKTIYAIIVWVMVISINSCKKSKSPEPFDNDPKATQTLKYLTQAPWKEMKLEYQLQDGTWLTFPVSASDAGLSYSFTSNGVYNTGPYTIYNASGGVYGSGVYDIIGDNTQLALNKNTTYDFVILNSTTMQLGLTSQVLYTDPATNNTYTYYGMRETFSH